MKLCNEFCLAMAMRRNQTLSELLKSSDWNQFAEQQNQVTIPLEALLILKRRDPLGDVSGLLFVILKQKISSFLDPLENRLEQKEKHPNHKIESASLRLLQNVLIVDDQFVEESRMYSVWSS